jgi:hypothetical protein
VSLESYLEDLQIHISQDLANSEAFANDRTIIEIDRTCAHQHSKCMLECERSHLK